MAHIRVDTEDLKNKAKDFESAGEAFNRAGDEIAALAMTLPSYDGQLSGPARKAGAGIQSQSREMKDALENDAQSLQKTAQDFETVDNETVSEIEYANASMKDSSQSSILLFSPGEGDDIILKYEEDGPLVGDKRYLGYQQDGWIITLYCNGESISYDIRFIDAETEQKIKEFMANANDANYAAKYSQEALNLVLAVQKVVYMGLGWCVSFFVEKADLLPGYEDIVTTTAGVEGASLQDYLAAVDELMKAEAAYKAGYEDDVAAGAEIFKDLSQSGDVPGKVETPE